MPHYSDHILNPITIQRVSDGSRFYPGVPNTSAPFVYNGSASQLKEMLDSGNYVIVSGASTLTVVTTDLIPQVSTDLELDGRISQFLTQYNTSSHVLYSLSTTFTGTGPSRLADFSSGQKFYPANNLAYQNANALTFGPSIGPGGFEWVETNAAEGTLTMHVATANRVFLVFRMSDHKNFWTFDNYGNSSNYSINKVVNGVVTQIAQYGTAATSNVDMQVVLDNTTGISVYAGGSLLGTVNTDSFNAGTSKVGLGSAPTDSNGTITSFTWTPKNGTTFISSTFTPTANPLLMFLGNSLVAGSGLADAARYLGLPALTADKFGTGYAFYNAGQDGQDNGGVATLFNNSAKYLNDTAYPKLKIFVWELTNSINENQSDATVISGMESLLTSCLALTNDVTMGTCLPRGTTTNPVTPTSFETSRGNVNSALRTWCAANGVKVADFDTVAIGAAGAYNNSTLYNNDLVHLKDAGYAQAATVVYNAMNAAVPVIAASVPTGVSATGGNNNVSINWTASTGTAPITYNILRSTTSGSETSLATGVTTSPYTDNTATNGTTYYYKVSATNAGGTSANSSEVSATPSAPSNLPSVTGASLVMQLDATKITGLSDGAALATWTDQSLNAYDATQATTANQPVYHTNVQNSKPAVRFAKASSQWMNLNAAINNNLQGEIFIVMQTQDNAGASGFYTMNSNGAGTSYCTFGGDIYDSFITQTRLNFTLTSPTNFNIYGASFDGTTLSLYENGVSKITGAASSSLTNRNYGPNIGASTQGTSGAPTNNFADLYICEIVMYDHQLSSGDRGAVVTYLRNKWATT